MNVPLLAVLQKKERKKEMVDEILSTNENIEPNGR